MMAKGPMMVMRILALCNVFLARSVCVCVCVYLFFSSCILLHRSMRLLLFGILNTYAKAFVGVELSDG